MKISFPQIRLISIYALNFILYFAVCPSAYAQSSNLPLGQIIDTVRCDHSPDQSYALYLPSDYTAKKTWPVIYFFEPMARGRLPLELYAAIAEKYGYLLICSNNSRNGAVNLSIATYKALKQDSQIKLSIDSERIYTSGFSGGARLAQYLVSTEDSITGVIAVAGPKLSNDEHTIRPQDYLYFGIVGNRDMNYVEHKNYQVAMNEAGIKNMLLTYAGGHQWPPVDQFETALKWLDTQHLLKQSNQTFGSEIETYISDAIISIDSTKLLTEVDKLSYLTSLKSSLLPFEDESLNSRIERLLDNKGILKAIAKEEKSLSKESKSYEQIYNALYQLRISSYHKNQPLDSTIYSMNWWQQQINTLKYKTKKQDGKGDEAARTLDVIRGQVFGITLQEGAKNNLDFKLNLNKIQCMLYPESVWLLWTQAIIFAERIEKELALECLKKANQLDSNRLQSIRQNQLKLAELYPYLFE